MIELAKARLGISRPMIGQSLVLTALTPIALPSTADVAALVCCGKTLASSADAPLQGTNEHKPPQGMPVPDQIVNFKTKAPLEHQRANSPARHTVPHAFLPGASVAFPCNSHFREKFCAVLPNLPAARRRDDNAST
jgi:hypothetical protein